MKSIGQLSCSEKLVDKGRSFHTYIVQFYLHAFLCFYPITGNWKRSTCLLNVHNRSMNLADRIKRNRSMNLADRINYMHHTAFCLIEHVLQLSIAKKYLGQVP